MGKLVSSGDRFLLAYTRKRGDPKAAPFLDPDLTLDGCDDALIEPWEAPQELPTFGL